jgi:hypothetical protein
MDLAPALENDIDEHDKDQNGGWDVADQPDDQGNKLLEVFHPLNSSTGRGWGRSIECPYDGDMGSRGPSALMSASRRSWLRITGV